MAMNGASRAEEATYAVFKALISKAGQANFYQKASRGERVPSSEVEKAWVKFTKEFPDRSRWKKE